MLYSLFIDYSRIKIVITIIKIPIYCLIYIRSYKLNLNFKISICIFFLRIFRKIYIDWYQSKEEFDFILIFTERIKVDRVIIIIFLKKD